MKKTDWVQRFNRDLDRMLQGSSPDHRDTPQDYQEALEVAGRLMAADFSRSREHQKALEARLLGQAETQLHPQRKVTLRQRLSGPAGALVWVLAGLLLALALIWGINNLRPHSIPGVPVVPSPEYLAPGPDLGKLAYVRGGDLWVKTLPDGEPQQLTTDGLNTQPRWSPSGEWLAYCHGDDQVWAMRSDGSDGHALAEARVSAFAWAPGEDSLAYILDDHELRLTDAGGIGDQTLVASEESQQIHNLAWSPDGNWIAYELRERQGDQASYLGLWKVPVSGAGAVEITGTTDFEMLAGIYQLAGWTSDGQSLIFWGGNPFFSASIAADGLPLVKVPANGGEPQEVAQSALLYTDFVRPDPSVSGRLAVITGGGREAWTDKRLYLFENSSGVQLSPGGEAVSSVAWSRDGKRLAYSSAPDAGQLGGGEPARQALMDRKIWVLDLGSGEPNQLTNDPSYRDEYPLWSADGNNLLFVRMDDQNQVSLWTIPVAGGEAQIVLDRLSTESLSSLGWFGFYGHIDWQDMFDWWRGPLPSTTTLRSTPSATWDGQLPSTLATSTTTPFRPTPTNTPRPTLAPAPSPTPRPSPTPDLGAMQETTTSFTSPDGEWVMRVARALPLDDQGELYADYGHDRVEVSSSDGTRSWTVIEEWFTLGLGLGGYEPYLWTPDGRYLYITYVPVPDGCALFVNGTDLRKVDLGSGEVTQLVPPVGLNISLSPDEDTLAYIGYRDRGLVLRDLETGQERQVDVYQSGDEAAGDILWSPDGSALVLTLAHQPCTTNWATSTSILRVDAETLEVTPLIEQDQRLFTTTEWSQPDQVILKDDNENLWTMDPGTGEAIPQK
jgi:Tol biopolymer transport system component